MRYGYNLLKKPAVQKEIDSIKKEMFCDLFVTGRDIINLYIKIAFADINDFVEFGYDDDLGKNYVNLKEHVDGQIIDEVSISTLGARVKLTDRFKAIEKLEKFFDVMGYDSWKKYIEERKFGLKNDGLDKVINVVTGIDRDESNKNEENDV